MINIKKIILTSIGMLFITANFLVSAQNFNLAFTPPLNSHYGDGAKAFAQEMKKLSRNKIKINLKPAGALGGEREVIEGLQIGSVDITIVSTGPVGSFVPDVYALDFPFLFEDYDHARSVLDGPIGKKLITKFTAKGLIGLAWSENGFRHVTTSERAVHKPSDLKGLKLRTMENQIHIAAFKSAGASPTPMSWTEVLTSLQQGTIDGQENPIPVLTANKMWEIQKNVTLTGHVYSPAVIIMSKIRWDRLNNKQKGWFRKAGKVAAAATRTTVSENEKNGVALLKKNGMNVISVPNKAAFARAVQPAYDQFAKKYNVEKLIKQIKNAKR